MTELFQTARFPFFMTCALLCIIDDISFRNEGHNKFVPGLLSSSSSYSNPLCCSIPKYQIPLWNPRNAPRPRIAPASSFRAFPENNSSTKDSMILFHGFHYFFALCTLMEAGYVFRRILSFDHEATVRQMVAEQTDMKIPSELIPKCPVCGAPMAINPRCDMTFVQDDGWYAASNRYDDFIRRHQNLHILFLELGVGTNTPVILQNPFWRMTSQNPKAVKPRKMLSKSYCRILTQNIKRAVIRYFSQNHW